MLTREKHNTQLPSAVRPAPKKKAPGIGSSLMEALETQRQNLLDKLAAETRAMAQASSEGDDADYANKTAGQSKRMAMQRLWENMLAEVERAIARVEHGTYGRCQGCGAAIPEDRLMAVPSAALCIGCARRQTHNVRTFG
jgi:RNA polymerase-binding protein DksA